MSGPHTAFLRRGDTFSPKTRATCPSGWDVRRVCALSYVQLSGLRRPWPHGAPLSMEFSRVRILGWVAILDSRSLPTQGSTLISCTSCIAFSSLQPRHQRSPEDHLNEGGVVRRNEPAFERMSFPVPGGIQSEAGRPGSGI